MVKGVTRFMGFAPLGFGLLVLFFKIYAKEIHNLSRSFNKD
jgi:hypothetical protein